MIIQYSPIGYFRTPFKQIKGMPVQPIGGKGVTGEIEVLPEFSPGLKDLDGFSHVFVLSHLHEIQGADLMVKPFLDKERHGIFATRSPKRPNPIALSVMRLLGVEENRVILEGIDMLDNTPILDIKPYVADFDQCDADRFGWFEGKSKNAVEYRSDERFVPESALCQDTQERI